MERKLETLPESLEPGIQKELSEILAALPKLETETSNEVAGTSGRAKKWKRKPENDIKSLFENEEVKTL